MSTSIDNRVVQMTFNNKSFEKGVDDTLKTLDKLNEKLKFKDASDGFENIQNASEHVEFKNLSDNVQRLADRFSGLGIIGMQIWSKIGDAAWDLITGPFKKVSAAINSIENQIKTGGWNRALNLDKAASMLKNLGQTYDSTRKSEEGWYEEVDGKQEYVYNRYKAINDAVTDTAYSFDEAAVASANFLAVNQKMSNADLTGTLRAAMGIASTYSKDFSQIAGYLQKVQSAGYLTKGIVSDMTQVGIAVEPIIKEYLHLENLSQEEMDKIYKNGLISFDQFRDALVWKFGDSLDKANETYEGSIANMKAAMSRTGAKFAEPLVASLIPAANEVRVIFNEINKAVGDSQLAQILPGIIDGVVKKVDSLLFITENGKRRLTDFGTYLKGTLFNYLRGFYYLIKSVIEIFKDFGQAFSEVFFGDQINKGLKKSDSFRESMKKLFELITNNKDRIVDAFKGFLYILKPFIKLAGILIKLALKVIGLVLKIAVVIVAIIGNIVTLIVESKIFQKILGGIKTGLEKVATWLKKTKDFIIEFFGELKLGEKISKGFHNLINAIKTFYEETQPLETALEFIKTAADKVWDALNFLVDKFEDLTGIDIKLPTLDDIIQKAKDVRDAIVRAFEDPKGTADALLEKLREVRDFLGDKFVDVVDTINEKFETFKNWLGGFTSGFDDAKKSMEDFSKSKGLEETEKKVSVLERISNALEGFGKAIDFVWETFKTAGEYIVDALKWAFGQIGDLTGIESFHDFLVVVADMIKILIRYNWAKAAASFGQFFGTLSKVFKQNLGVKSNTALKTIPNALLKISIAMGILALSVIAMAQLKTEDIVQAELALMGIVAIAGLLIKVMSAAKNLFAITDAEGNVIQKTKKTVAEKLTKQIISRFGKAADLAALGVTITAIGTALLEVMLGIVAIAKILQDEDGKVNKEALATALIAFTAIIVILFAALHFMLKEVQNFKKESLDDKTNTLTEFQRSSSWASLLGLSAFIVALANVMIIIVAAIAALSLIPKENLVRGGLALGIILAALVAIMGLAVFFTQNLKNSSNGDGKILKKSSGGNGGALAGLALFLVGLAAAIKIIVPMLAILGVLPEDVFWQGARGIIVIGAVIALCVWAASKVEHSLKSAVVLLSIVIALAAVAAIMDTIGHIKNLKNVVIALAVIGVVIGVLMFLAGKLKYSYEAAVTIIAIGAALYLSALAVKEIAELKWKKDWWKTLIVIGVFIAALAGLAALVTKIPSLQWGLGVVAGSMLAAGAGIFLFVAALTMLVPLIEEVYEKRNSLAGKIQSFCDIVAETIVGLFLAIIEAFEKKVDTFVSAAGGVLLAILSGIANFLLKNHKEIGDTIGNFFAAVVIIIVEAIATFCGKITDALKENFGIGEDGESSSWANVGSGLIKGLAVGLDFVGTTLEDAMDAIAKFLEDVVDDPDHAWEGVGNGLVNSLIRGLTMMQDSLVSAVTGVYNAIYNALPGWAQKLLFPAVYEAEHEKAWKDFITVVRDEQKKFKDEVKYGNAKEFSEAMGISGTDYSGEFTGDSDFAAINTYAKQYEEYAKLAKESADAITKNKWNYDKDKNNPLAYLAFSGYNTAIEGMKQSWNAYQAEVERLASEYYETDFFTLWVENGYDDKGVMTYTEKRIPVTEMAYYKLGNATIDGYRNGIIRNGYAADKETTDWLSGIYENSARAIGSTTKITNSALTVSQGKSKSFESLGEASGNSYTNGLMESMKYANRAFSSAISGIETTAQNANITPVFNYSAFQNQANSLGEAIAMLKTDVQIQVDLMNNTNQSRIDAIAQNLAQSAADTTNALLLTKIDHQNEVIDDLSNKIDTIGLYLDGDLLVGGIAGRIDTALGKNILNIGRGVRR